MHQFRPLVIVAQIPPPLRLQTQQVAILHQNIALTQANLKPATRLTILPCRPHHTCPDRIEFNITNRCQKVLVVRRAYLCSKGPAAVAFQLPEPYNVVDMLKADLEAAGIPYRDDADRVADDWRSVDYLGAK